ncbi:transketolase [Candidatus Nomurabacteria bacterium RIFCSPHIGHO2_01_FULL_41_91]|uniref:Transketolase n=1 Tax=Candidatus Nomurabacteria bacterium RIFCSPLOWO2_12_FULL_41_10 TaxID=1801795 RepID=A0A1F6YCC9_9BACT|nr:MAG: transketolase [Candidatus Nomurabacteria bacterium RIFCSPHIGHO2_01_FULL_41_91]OGI85193.1 MAG: transketolase [Candidatus Nomurabacteria bacterium RIFCSPHIGHO2_12_FULL_42_19]OGI99478.1 MAG: transketolase [Candidatus Nomurabacteria bacterium RIFCSPLOWO2_02_FULL_42_24]OGJ04053.1 MAG: transketolase [Candidatus Nomurabacteria bacterium RIFCSPLOWO2_12_FULL_41_10]
MLNPKLKLNPKIFNDDVEQVNIRKGFGEGLVLAGETNKNVVALCADLTESTQMIFFKEKFPERFVEVGVAEQNLATVASGMAAMGKIPFISSYAMFSPGRNWEQIRTTIAYNNRPVKIIGSHGGISVGADGGTHQALEDIALMRVMPNMDIVSPCDALEAKKATIALAKTEKPAYLRLLREKTPIITTEKTPFNLGKAEIYWLPDAGLAQVGIIVTGGLLHRALLAAKELESEGIKTKVMNLVSIKPIDMDAIIALAKECKAIVTVEEHQVMGGMGSAVAEVLAQNFSAPVEFIGIKDKFGQSGTPDELIEHYGMGKNAIKEAVKRVLKRKV